MSNMQNQMLQVIKVDEQITTITVEAGTIDDFFVNVKSKGTYSSIIKCDLDY